MRFSPKYLPIKDNTGRFAVRSFLLLLLVFSLILAFRIILPLINAITLAVVFAGLFFPLQKRLGKIIRNKNICALINVLIISLLIVIPLFFVTLAMVQQGIQFTNSLIDWVKGGTLQEWLSNENIEVVKHFLHENVPYFNANTFDLQSYVLNGARAISEFFITHGAGIIGNIAVILTYFFIMIFILFFLLRDGEQIIRAVKHLSPLREYQENRLLHKIRMVARSVFMGTILTGIVQGLVGGISLSIVGLPGIFWGTMMAFASLIPIVGVTVIYIPAAAYLALQGQWESALFVFIWNAILASLTDNLIRPLFVQGGSGMSVFWVLLSILGGVQIFGFAGLLYGPLSFAFAMIMLSIYEEEFSQMLDSKDKETEFVPAAPKRPVGLSRRRPLVTRRPRRMSKGQ